MKKSLLVGSAVVAAAAFALLRSKRKLDLRGKVVLITGGSRGLGLALAHEFAGRGAHLLLCARDAEELDRAKNDLVGSAGRVETFVCDVTDPAQVRGFIGHGLGKFGRVDVLVNNAGEIRVGPVHTMAIEDFEHAMDVMFWGMVHASLDALPHFRGRGEGSIVNITSVGGKVSIPHLLPYSCAKFAAVAFSEGLRAEVAGDGVNVLTIAPGLMRTGSHVNAVYKGAEAGEAGWFAAGASLPGISMSAEQAAQQIVDAVEQGRGELVLSAPANLLARFNGLFPELTTSILGIVNSLLPKGSERVEKGKDSPILQQPWMKALTMLGTMAAKRYLENAGGNKVRA